MAGQGEGHGEVYGRSRGGAEEEHVRGSTEEGKVWGRAWNKEGEVRGAAARRLTTCSVVLLQWSGLG